MLRALIVKPPPGRDLYRVMRIGCAEAKKAFRVRGNLTVVDLVERSYGFVVVVDDGADAGAPLKLGAEGQTR